MRSLLFLALCALTLGCSSNGSAPSPTPSGTLHPQEIRQGGVGDDGRVFYPDRSVACDRATRICYSGGEASVAATERYLGEGAARNLKERLIDRQKEPKWVFEPDGDTSCDMRTQVCYSLKGPSVNKTRRYFGEAAASRLEQNLSGGGATPPVTRPKRRLGCDASVQICYDENGPNVKQTKKYFGEEAAKRLKKQIPH